MFIRFVDPSNPYKFLTETKLADYQQYFTASPTSTTITTYFNIPAHQREFARSLIETFNARWGVSLKISDDSLCSVTGLSSAVYEVIKELVVELGQSLTTMPSEFELAKSNGFDVDVFISILPNEPYTMYRAHVSYTESKQLFSTIAQIRPFVTINNIDTENLTEDQQLKLGGNHVALADLYLLNGGNSYRHHCSSRERAYMIAQFEENSELLQKYKNLSCVTLDDHNAREMIRNKIDIM